MATPEGNLRILLPLDIAEASPFTCSELQTLSPSFPSRKRELVFGNSRPTNNCRRDPPSIEAALRHRADIFRIDHRATGQTSDLSPFTWNLITRIARQSRPSSNRQAGVIATTIAKFASADFSRESRCVSKSLALRERGCISRLNNTIRVRCCVALARMINVNHRA